MIHLFSFFFFFLLSYDSYFRRVVAAGIQPVSGPTSNIASLCVFYNALCWWMCRGISGRSVSGAEGHTMWNIQSLCEHCAFSISGSCVTRATKTPRNDEARAEMGIEVGGEGGGEGRGGRVRVLVVDHASARPIVFLGILHGQRACQNIPRTYMPDTLLILPSEEERTWTYA